MAAAILVTRTGRRLLFESQDDDGIAVANCSGSWTSAPDSTLGNSQCRTSVDCHQAVRSSERERQLAILSGIPCSYEICLGQRL